MEIQQRGRREEVFYRNLKRRVDRKGEKILQKIPEMMDHGKHLAFEERGWLFDRSRVI